MTEVLEMTRAVKMSGCLHFYSTYSYMYTCPMELSLRYPSFRAGCRIFRVRPGLKVQYVPR